MDIEPLRLEHLILFDQKSKDDLFSAFWVLTKPEETNRHPQVL